MREKVKCAFVGRFFIFPELWLGGMYHIEKLYRVPREDCSMAGAGIRKSGGSPEHDPMLYMQEI